MAVQIELAFEPALGQAAPPLEGAALGQVQEGEIAQSEGACRAGRGEDRGALDSQGGQSRLVEYPDACQGLDQCNVSEGKGLESEGAEELGGDRGV